MIDRITRVLWRLGRDPSEIRLRVGQQLWNLKARGSTTIHNNQSPAKFSRGFFENFFVNEVERAEICQAIKRTYPNYIKDLCDEAEYILKGEYTLLGMPRLSFSQGDVPDFHWDPVNGGRLGLRWWKKELAQAHEQKVDLKIIWEFNRNQYLVTLGLAYVLTDEEKYREKALELFKCWVEQNPPYFGINWSSSLELSFRSISWLWTWQLLRCGDECEINSVMINLLLAHGDFIVNNLSTHHSPNTHLTGEALGLFYLGLALQDCEDGKYWITLAEEILGDWVDRHILEDGGYVERSFWYQLYTIDIYLHYFLLARRFERPILPQIQEALERASDYLYWAMTPDFKAPHFGDDDGGKLLRLAPGNVDGDVSEVLSCAGVIFKRHEYARNLNQLEPQSFFLLGTDAEQVFSHLLETDNCNAIIPGDPGITGYHVLSDWYKGHKIHLVFYCGTLGWLNSGHGHADILSFTLQYGNQKIVVDSGTYTYSGRRRDKFRRAEAHSTLIIDDIYPAIPGAQPFHWKSKCSGRLLEVLNEDKFSSITARLVHDHGNEKITVHDRTVYLVRFGVVIILDQIEGNRPVKVVRRFPLAGIDWRISGNDQFVSELNNISFLIPNGTDGSLQMEPHEFSECYGSLQHGQMLIISNGCSPPALFVTAIYLKKSITCQINVSEHDMVIELRDQSPITLPLPFTIKERP